MKRLYAMVDFHSHFIPGIDDGAADVPTGAEMLRESYRQGVRLMCATPHFYADEDDPKRFLANRDEAYRRLRDALGDEKDIPEIVLGAEVLYFPGISVADEVRALAIGDTPFLLIEPPMVPWSETMLDEIEQCGSALRCVPVVAHIDRYMRLLRAPELIDRVRGRRMLVQVNASFFLYPEHSERALELLREGRVHFIGSDCHDLARRAPNLGEADRVIRSAGMGSLSDEFHQRIKNFLKGTNQ